MASIALAHTNLALVKYWGKEDEGLRLPSAPSLSLTLEAFYTRTRLRISKENRFFLNGKEKGGKDAERVFSYLSSLLAFFRLPPSKFVVESENFVPKSSGFASSSSAFCALAAAFAEEMGLSLTKRELSIAARMGSGSACRSVFGGLVLWKEGKTSGESFAVPIKEAPSMDICALYLSLEGGEKEVSSTEGMRISRSSPFFQIWREECRKACAEIQEALKAGSFERVGEMAERNACQMHALTLSCGFSYISEKSLRALRLAQSMRKEGIPCYWTCDAGSNAAFLCRKKDMALVEGKAKEAFGSGLVCFPSGPGPGVKVKREV